MQPNHAERASVFGSVADAYDRLRPGYPDAAVDWLLPPHAHRVADVAAGTGKLTDSLLARGLEVVAIEPDAEMLAVLTARLPTVEAHQAPAEELPLPDHSVDTVIVAQAWHWFDPVPAYAEMCRVTRPGGWLGLIGHRPSPTEPWEHELAALDPLGVDHANPPASEPELPGLPDVSLETASFPYVREITPTDLAALYATYSIYAVMPADERAERLAAIVALAGREADRRGRPTVGLTSMVECDRVFLRA